MLILKFLSFQLNLATKSVTIHSSNLDFYFTYLNLLLSFNLYIESEFIHIFGYFNSLYKNYYLGISYEPYL